MLPSQKWIKCLTWHIIMIWSNGSSHSLTSPYYIIRNKEDKLRKRVPILSVFANVQNSDGVLGKVNFLKGGNIQEAWHLYLIMKPLPKNTYSYEWEETWHDLLNLWLWFPYIFKIPFLSETEYAFLQKVYFIPEYPGSFEAE